LNGEYSFHSLVNEHSGQLVEAMTVAISGGAAFLLFGLLLLCLRHCPD
jgi:hypothetical protein